MRDEIEASVSTSKLKLFACVLPEKSTSQLPHLRVAKIEKKKNRVSVKSKSQKLEAMYFL